MDGQGRRRPRATVAATLGAMLAAVLPFRLRGWTGRGGVREPPREQARGPRGVVGRGAAAVRTGAADFERETGALALASTPEHVYERALRVFAAEDVAEAFAASRSITIPGQLRSMLRADRRDLIGQFRRLAPQRHPVPIQLWGIRRAAVTAGLLAALAAAVAVVGRFAGNLYDVFPGGCVTYSFDFEFGSQIVLMEQFETATGLYSRQQLRLSLRKRLGVELDP